MSGLQSPARSASSHGAAGLALHTTAQLLSGSGTATSGTAVGHSPITGATRGVTSGGTAGNASNGVAMGSSAVGGGAAAAVSMGGMGTLQLEVELLQRRAATMEDRLAVMEKAMARVTARVEDVAERLTNDMRTVEAGSVAAVEAQESASRAVRRCDTIEAMLSARFEGEEARIKADIDLRTTARIESALAAVTRDLQERTTVAHSELLQRVQRAEGAAQDVMRRVHGVLHQGMTSVKAHVSKELDRHTLLAESQLQSWDQLRQATVSAQETLSTTIDEFRGDLAELSTDVRRAINAVATHDTALHRTTTEVQAIQRRLLSVLRHFGASDQRLGDRDHGLTAASLQEGISPVQPAPADATAWRSRGPASAMRGGGGGPDPHDGRQEGMATGGSRVSRTQLVGGLTQDESPIDNFLAELSLLARTAAPDASTTGDSSRAE